MFNKKMQYVIKSVPTDDKQALEDLLNTMSDDGWELYTMHEIETENSIDFNCIFAKEKQECDDADLDDIVSVQSFKYRMEKMLAAPASPYESCKEIQLKITNQKEKIKNIKSQLESDNLSGDNKNQLNNQMSVELKQLETLKQTLVNEISPEMMYSSIKEEKFTINLSDEILDMVSEDNPDNLLAETVKVRQHLTDTLGYVIPHIHFHNSDSLNQNEISICIHDIEVFRTLIFPNYRVYCKDELNGYKIQGDDIVITDDLSGKKLVWIQEEKVKDFWQRGLSASEYIGKIIEEISIREVSDIMDYNDVNSYVEIVLKSNSFLVDNLIPNFLTASDLKYLLSCLIRERVSVKNIVYLFEKINDYANEPTKEDLLDKVRLAFSKLIIKDLAKDDVLKVMEFSDETLDIIGNFFNQEDDGETVIRIDANDVEEIAEKINKIAKSKKLDNPVITVPMELRHMTFVILSEFVKNITVIANEELATNCNVKFIGKI
ncbi:MAG: FHIPEP family type III secretion protein [bacterium]|nr:FHIPEP family type III secretion protein [bacterium]